MSTKTERLKFYKDTLDRIMLRQFEFNYVCNIASKSKVDIPEYLLFKEKDTLGSSWVSGQIDTHYWEYEDLMLEQNEYRVFMLQLCIEMLK